MKLRVLSYNIHKGFNTGNRQFVLSKIKEAIRSVGADLVFLQEVQGQHTERAKKVKEWPAESQFEFLADEVWPHFAYGKNAVYTSGHHGNAILSKYPITEWSNINISTNPLESRGILHVVINVPDTAAPLHALCVHLNMLERGRKKQLHAICERVIEVVPADHRLIIAGDFNDWSGKASGQLKEELQVEELFLLSRGAHAGTYPSIYPVFKLDRIYCRHVRSTEGQVLSKGVWQELSDHAALFAVVELGDGS